MIRYGSIFATIGVGLAALAAVFGAPARWSLLWSSGGFALIAVAYFFERPRLLGKRDDGSVAMWARLSALPVLLLEHLLLFSHRLRDEAPCDEVAPELWVGGLPVPETLPPGVTTIVDLTSEIAAHREVRQHPGYRCYPMLDDGFPLPGEIERIVGQLVDLPGPMLIHCAAGHGRSSTLAAAVGLARGLFRDPSHAEASMRRARPKIGFKPVQRQRLEAWFASHES